MKVRDNYPDGNILWFNDFYLDGNDMFFSAGNFNALYQYSLESEKLNFLGNFDNEFILRKQLYGKIHRFENQLIFTPMSAGHVAIYDMDRKMFESVPLPAPGAPCGFDLKFLNSVMHGDSIYAFPGYGAYIMEYNVKTKSIRIHDDWHGKCVNKWGKKSNLLFHFDMARIEDNVYLPSAQHNGIFRYCLNGNTHELIELGHPCKSIDTLAYDGKRLWCSANDGTLLIADSDGTIAEKIDIAKTYGTREVFFHSVYDNGNLWLFASQSGIALKIDCGHYNSMFEMSRYCEFEKEYTNYEYHAINFVERKKEGVVFMCRADRSLKWIQDGSIKDCLHGITDSTGYADRDVHAREAVAENMDHRKKASAYMQKNGEIVLTENKDVPVRAALEWMLDTDITGILAGNNANNCGVGRKIYRAVCG